MDRESQLDDAPFGLSDAACAICVRSDGDLVPGDGLSPGMGVEAALGFSIGGRFSRVECVRPDGSTRWVVDGKNAFNGGSLDLILNTFFRAGTPPAAFYVGLIDNAGYTALASTDTITSHAGWAEFTGYTDAARNAWSPGASASQSIVNSVTTNYAISSTGVLRGLFTVTDSTKGGTAGTLISTATFTGGTQNVTSGDTLKVTYTVSATTS